MSKSFDNQRGVADNNVRELFDDATVSPWRLAVRRAQRKATMPEGPKKGQNSGKSAVEAAIPGTPGSPALKGNVEAFASRVLSVVAANTISAGNAPREQLVDALIEAASSYDGAARDQMLRRFREAGIDSAGIIDRYMPAAARKLGAAWCEDSLSFADVTIGTARLQSILRDLRAPQVTDPSAPNALIIVPPDAFHTLGATVVADQLRRLGVAPRMAMGLPPLDLAELVESHDFNVVLISAASSQRVETIRELVNCVRKASRAPVPIVVGGTIMDKDTDIRTLTGADYVSNNPSEALKACGLRIPTHAVEPPGPQT